MVFKKSIIGAAIAATAGFNVAYAQDEKDVDARLKELQSEIQVLKQALEKQAEKERDPKRRSVTKRELDGVRADIENYKYDVQQDRERRTVLTRRSLTVGGTFQARAIWNNPETTSDANTPADERHNTFEIPQALINFTGSLYRDYTEGKNLTFRVQFGYARNNPANGGSQLNLNDAYLDYSFFPTTAGLEEPKLTLRLGQQQIPFGLEAQVGEELRPVITSAQFINAFGVGRQTGLILRGDYKPYVDYGFNYRAPLLEYNIGIVNGNGINRNDDNEDKDLIARLAFTLPVDYYSVFRELKFGTSYYKGKTNLVSGGVVEGQGDNEIVGYDIYYNHAPFGVTYEYARQEVELLGGATRQGKGQYLTLFYTWGEQWFNSYRNQAKYDDWWPKSLQLFARWDELDPNQDVDNDKTTVSTVGLNFFFAETTKFQFNLSHTDYESDTIKNANAVIAQFQFGF